MTLVGAFSSSIGSPQLRAPDVTRFLDSPPALFYTELLWRDFRAQ